MPQTAVSRPELCMQLWRRWIWLLLFYICYLFNLSFKLYSDYLYIFERCWREMDGICGGALLHPTRKEAKICASAQVSCFHHWWLELIITHDYCKVICPREWITIVTFPTKSQMLVVFLGYVLYKCEHLCLKTQSELSFISAELHPINLPDIWHKAAHCWEREEVMGEGQDAPKGLCRQQLVSDHTIWIYREESIVWVCAPLLFPLCPLSLFLSPSLTLL